MGVCSLVGISLFMGLHPDIDALSRNRDAYVGHPYAFRLFAMMVCNLLIFKMNSAYQRYWEARSLGGLDVVTATFVSPQALQELEYPKP